jgi:hypothetical protein
MAVPISEIVRVKVSSSETLAIEQNQNGCCLTPNALVPIGDEGYLIGFQNANKVGEYFGITSDEYKQAEAYFSGYQGVNEAPDFMWFGRLIMGDAVSPWIRSGISFTVNSLTDIKTAYPTGGTLNFLFDGLVIPVIIVPADLASATTLATKIQTALTTFVKSGETTPYMAGATAIVQNDFSILVNSNMTGASHTVLPCTSPNTLTPPATNADAFAIAMGFGNGLAVTSQGADVETFANNFDKITYNDTPFVGFWFKDGFRNSDKSLNTTLILEVANYLANQNDQYICAVGVNGKVEALSLITTLKNNNYAHSITLSDGSPTYDLNTPLIINNTYKNGEMLNAWMFGAMAVGVDYHYPMNKTTGILIGENMTDQDYQDYLSYACNVYCRFKGTTPLNTYRIGRCGDTGANVGLYGSQNSIDKFYGQNRIRKDIQDSVSYRMIVSGESIGADTNTGGTAVKNLIVSILELEVTRGWIATGKTWTSLQDQETLRQLSRNLEVDQGEIQEALTNTGYWVSQGEYISDVETMRYFIAYISQGAVLTVDINLNAVNY